MSTIKLEDILAGPQTTTDSQLVINMPDKKLPVGAHRLQLTVADDAGNLSKPAIVTVIVIDTEAPTAIVDVRDAEGRPLENNSISFGEGFILSGKRSTDAGGGRIVKYVWELVPQ
jgi:hypothetical protein